jgi:hypothetical protein
MESWKKPGAPKIPENVQKAAEALAKELEEIHAKFVPPQFPPGWAGPPVVYTPPPLPQRIGRLGSAIGGYTAAPTAQQMEELDVLSKLLAETMDKLKKLVDEDLANLNKMMNEAGIPHITAAPPGAPATPRRR